MHFNCTFKRILLLWLHTFIIILIAWAIIICQFRNERETMKNTRLEVCILGTNNFLLITPILMTIFHIGLEKFVIQQLNIFYVFSKMRSLTWGDLYVENNTFKFSFHFKTQGNRSEFSFQSLNVRLIAWRNELKIKWKIWHRGILHLFTTFKIMKTFFPHLKLDKDFVYVQGLHF